MRACGRKQVATLPSRARSTGVQSCTALHLFMIWPCQLERVSNCFCIEWLMSGGVRRARQSLQGLGECARDAHPHDIHLGACAHIPQYSAPDPKPTNLGRPLGLEGQELRWGRRRGTHALLDTLLRRSGRSHLLHRERLLQPISIRFALIEPNSTRMLQDNTHKPGSSPRSCFTDQ